MKSATAVPSLRNSGFDTTGSGPEPLQRRISIRSISSPVPGGTVLGSEIEVYTQGDPFLDQLTQPEAVREVGVALGQGRGFVHLDPPAATRAIARVVYVEEGHVFPRREPTTKSRPSRCSSWTRRPAEAAS